MKINCCKHEITFVDHSDIDNMKAFSYILFLSTVILFLLSSCEKKEIDQSDKLEQMGVLGKWKLQMRTINGITDLIAPCCDFIEFKADNESGDLKGNFVATSPGNETAGVFEINTAAKTIRFEFNNKQMSYEYFLSETIITFTYWEDELEIIEDWAKED